ncbi:sensor histidine kinase [Croceimicrobium sp.]|uniref:sensor histidine kinase n=1 Tax=Croceimicrobium sp. TaxID=2828340 RepID=UPI003BABA27D
MRLDKPGILAFIIALILGIAVLTAFSALQASYGFEGGPTYLPWLLGLSLFVLAYFMIRLGVEQFVYSKVKIIYKNIHELKIGSETEEEELARSTDLDRVTKEVSEWATQNRNEIAELRERENFRREFIGNISHELKTPIFNIQGYLLTLLDGAIDDQEINRRYLKRANKSVDRMINIIEDLEVIAALESDRVQINYESFDLTELVEGVFELLEDKAHKKHVQFKIKKELDRPLKVLADRAKIEQVLINLIGNAIKYGNENGQIEVRFFDMDKHILTEVSDDGIGIPPEDVPRIFERFYRVDKSRSRDAGGTGLGLSIVKHIIEAHKQTINVRSSENKGSTFSFTLKKS